MVSTGRNIIIGADLSRNLTEGDIHHLLKELPTTIRMIPFSQIALTNEIFRLSYSAHLELPAADSGYVRTNTATKVAFGSAGSTGICVKI